MGGVFFVFVFGTCVSACVRACVCVCVRANVFFVPLKADGEKERKKKKKRVKLNYSPSSSVFP